MASSALASPFFPTRTPNPNRNAASPRRLSLRLHGRPSRHRHVIASSTAPGAAAAAAASAAAARQRRILESYGLNPDDFTEEAPAEERERGRRRRRRREERAEEEAEGKGSARRRGAAKGAVAAPPRETHRLLQVLGGKARRRKLLSPKGADVRPMMEVVRGAAFDILQSAGGSPASLTPGRWLDLYSGTGSVGIEAMSRGCSEVHFVEMDPWVVSEVLRPNLECTGFLDVSHIHMIRVENFLEHAEKSTGKVMSFDYISVTPPYIEVNYSTLLDQLSRSPLVGEDCFILVEYPLKTSMAESCGNLVKITDRRFGRTNLLIYGPTWAEKKRR